MVVGGKQQIFVVFVTSRLGPILVHQCFPRRHPYLDSNTLDRHRGNKMGPSSIQHCELEYFPAMRLVRVQSSDNRLMLISGIWQRLTSEEGSRESVEDKKKMLSDFIVLCSNRFLSHMHAGR